jgi:hypothetical protein
MPRLQSFAMRHVKIFMRGNLPGCHTMYTCLPFHLFANVDLYMLIAFVSNIVLAPNPMP